MSEKDKNFDDIMKTASENLGTDADKLKSAAQSGMIKNMISSMNSDQAKKLQDILSNKEETEKILSSPQAQALMKKFMNDKGSK
ncbi:MAG: hypothetical protein Q8876_06340 [Bacillota bacterium]|nr:hypothetical protein [Bacillota bacterium]